MQCAQYVALSLLGGLLVVGCFSNNPGDDTQSATTTTGSTTGNSQSGSVTSAPGSATDETGSDSAPTMATTLTGQGGSTGEPCGVVGCEDLPSGGWECDPFVQDCPEGQKCAAYIHDDYGFWNAAKCVDVTGTDKPGEPCTSADVASGVDSCIKGAMCWEVDMNGDGFCVAQCTGSNEDPMCEFKTSCTIFAVPALILCLPDCDPLLQDCGQGVACYPIEDSFTCTSDESGEVGQANDPCEFINTCDPGLMCADAALVGLGCLEGSMGCCTPFCMYPDGACPNPDQQCVQYFDPIDLPADDPWLDIGFCGVPG